MDQFNQDTKIVKGVLGLASNRREPVFADRFVILNTETAVLSIYPQAYMEVAEEIDLRFSVLIDDLDQEKREI